MCPWKRYVDDTISYIKEESTERVLSKLNGYHDNIEGKVGETTLKSLRNTLKSVKPANNTCKIIYTGTKLAPKFNIKDKINKEHKHDLIFKAQCHHLNCDETYRGEIGRGFSEWVTGHSGCDDKSHLYEHAEKTGHENVNIDYFKILSNGYKNNKFKRKHIRQYILNMKDLLWTLKNSQCHYSCSTDKVQRRSWNRQTSEMAFFWWNQLTASAVSCSH